MSEPSRYLTDANVLITAHRHYYGFDLCPGFWQSLLHHFAEGRVLSIDRVKRELESETDALAGWVKNVVPSGFFATTDDDPVIQQFSDMMAWVQAQAQFRPEAKAEFAQVADGWLIAYAKAHGLTVVTHEVYAADVKKKVPIPNVCREFGVPFVDTFAMLKDLGVQFSWNP